MAGPAGLGVHRTVKPAQPRLYLVDPLATESRKVAPAQLPFEFLMNALRLTEGVAWETFRARTGCALDVLEPGWSTGVELGLLERDRLATTALGYRHLDGVLRTFLR